MGTLPAYVSPQAWCQPATQLSGPCCPLTGSPVPLLKAPLCSLSHQPASTSPQSFSTPTPYYRISSLLSPVHSAGGQGPWGMELGSWQGA